MISNKKVLAVVLARSNSQGLPGKNYKEFSGQPLFMWSIKAAEKSRYIDKIVLTSRCKKVLSIYSSYHFYQYSIIEKHLNYIVRSEELDGPSVRNEMVVLDALYHIQDRDEYIPDYIVMLQPTSPFRYNGLIDKCIEKIDMDSSDSLMTAEKKTPFFWTINENRASCINDYYKDRPMRQELKSNEFMFHDNGNVYITKYDKFMEYKNRLCGDVSIYPTESYYNIQIDTQEDFDFAELAYNIKGYVI